jgi:hypothetical protein
MSVRNSTKPKRRKNPPKLPLSELHPPLALKLPPAPRLLAEAEAALIQLGVAAKLRNRPTSFYSCSTEGLCALTALFIIKVTFLLQFQLVSFFLLAHVCGFLCALIFFLSPTIYIGPGFAAKSDLHNGDVTLTFLT